MTISNKNNITKRSDKSSPLTHDELDRNFDELGNVIDDASANENALQTHENAADPHPQYATDARVDDIEQGNTNLSSASVTSTTGTQTLSAALDDRVEKGEVGAESVTSATGTQTVVDALDQRGPVFDSVADMKAASGLTVGIKCRTLGYSSLGDGRGNKYEIVNASSGTDDGESFIDLPASGYQAKKVNALEAVGVSQTHSSLVSNIQAGIAKDGAVSSLNGIPYKVQNSTPVKSLNVGDFYPAVQQIESDSTISYGSVDYSVINDGVADDRYYFGPRIAKSPDGRLHQTYTNNLFHGYGGFLENEAVDPEGKVVYRHSDDNGATWSNEQIVAEALPPSTQNVFRSIFGVTIGVTPSGRIVIVANDVPPPSSQWNRDTGSTKYRWFINDENGAPGAWVDKGVFLTTYDDYARIYTPRIKNIPAVGGGERMAFCDYRRVNNVPEYTIGMFYSDDEFETAPVEGSPIMLADGGDNETDFEFIDAKNAYSVSRSGGAIRKTSDGGTTWSYIGRASDYGVPQAGDFVAPALNSVWKDGEPYLLMSWTDRGILPRKIRWSVAKIREMQKFEDEVALGNTYMPWTGIYQTGPDLNGSSGYHSPIVFDDYTVLYSDCSEDSVSPTTGYMRCSTRIVRASIGAWFPTNGIILDSKKSRLGQYNDNEIDMSLQLEASTNGTYTENSNLNYHVRIGRRVDFNAYVSFTSITGFTGTLYLSGLPFTATDNSGAPNGLVNVNLVSDTNTPIPDCVGLVIKNTKKIQLYRKNTTTNALIPLENSAIGSTFTAYISGFYFARYSGPEGL